MAKRNSKRVRISNNLYAYLENISKELTKEAKWRTPVKLSEASRYLAELLNKKATLRIRKKGKNKIFMDLLWEE